MGTQTIIRPIKLPDISSQNFVFVVQIPVLRLYVTNGLRSVFPYTPVRQPFNHLPKRNNLLVRFNKVPVNNRIGISDFKSSSRWGVPVGGLGDGDRSYIHEFLKVVPVLPLHKCRPIGDCVYRQSSIRSEVLRMTTGLFLETMRENSRAVGGADKYST
jgi:hypothetical protein